MTWVTWGFPFVTVPVLSSTTVSTVRAISKAWAERTRMPCSAPLPVPTIMAVGVARPKAQGQEITSTPMPIDMANSKLFPMSSQTAKVTRAIPITAGTKTPLTLSANLAMGALLAPASSTRRMIC